MTDQTLQTLATRRLAVATFIALSMAACAPVGAAASAGTAARRGKDHTVSALTVLATLKSKPGDEEDFGCRLKALVAPTRAEPGCINYDLHQSTDEPAVWMLYENWVSRAALDAHFEMPYLKNFLSRMHEVLAADLEIAFFRHVEAA